MEFEIKTSTPNIEDGVIVITAKTSQQIVKFGQRVALNKNGTIRRTNRNKLTIGRAVSKGGIGDSITVQVWGWVKCH